MKDEEKRDERQIRRGKLLRFLRQAVKGSGYDLSIYEPSVHPFEAEALGLNGGPCNGMGWVYTGKIYACFTPSGRQPVETSVDKTARLQEKLGRAESLYIRTLNAKTKLLNEIYGIIENCTSGDVRKKLVALWKQDQD